MAKGFWGSVIGVTGVGLSGVAVSVVSSFEHANCAGPCHCPCRFLLLLLMMLLLLLLLPLRCFVRRLLMLIRRQAPKCGPQ